jgi:hypothetical protein
VILYVAALHRLFTLFIVLSYVSIHYFEDMKLHIVIHFDNQNFATVVMRHAIWHSVVCICKLRFNVCSAYNT